jgi:hypothetical protein
MYAYSTSHMAPPRPLKEETAASLIYPCYSARDQLRRVGKKPKDHHRANVARLRALEAKARVLRRSADEENVAPRPVPAAYRDVGPKVMRPSTAPACGRPFLRAGEKNSFGPPPKSTRPYTPRVRTKPAVPRATDTLSIDHASRDCVQENIEAIAELEEKQWEEKEAASAPAPPPASGPGTETYGRVPHYLVVRQAEEAARKKALKEEATAAALPGVLLSEQERLSMLHEMQEAFAVKSVELQRMPIVVSTVGLKNKKAALERQLDELEKGIRRFSNPKVYVAK